MKNLSLTIFFIALALFTFGQECVVKISYSVNKTSPPGYSFKTDYAGNEAKYYWYFGDNTMSDSPTPIHNYKTTGTYEINLKIVDKNNNVCYGKLTDKLEGGTTVTNQVILYGKGIVVNSGVEGCELLIYLENGSVLKPLKIATDFALKDGQYVEFAYEFVNEQTNCNLGKPVVIHRISEIPINTQCKAYFLSEMVPSTGDLASKTVVFANKSTGDISEIKWSFGDGEYSTELNPKHEYKEYGEYKVCMVIVTEAGCKSDYCGTVKVLNTIAANCEFDLTFQHKPETTNTFVFNTVSKAELTSWKWSFGDGTTAEKKEVVHAYEKPGIYEVVCVITSVNCTSRKMVKVEVKQADECKAYFLSEMVPSTGDLASKTVVFANKSTGDISEIKWSFGDGEYSTELNPKHEYKEYGEYKVCMVIVTEAGCKSDYCGTVKVLNTIAANCEFDLTFQHKPETTNIFVFNTVSKAELTSWKWSFGDGTTAEKKEIVHAYEKPGIYEVVCVITSANCTSRKMVKVEVNTSTSPTCNGAINLMLVEPTLNMCNGKATVKLLDENGDEFSGVNYFWSNGKTGETVEGLCYDKPYLVHSVIEKTCQKNTSFTFISKPSWKAFTSGINSIFEVMDPKVDLSYKWDFGDGHEAFGVAANHVYADEGVYNVKLTVIGEGNSEEFSKEVSILKSAQPGIEIVGNDFDFYPNPATSQLQIVFGELQTGNYIFEIIDLKGIQVLTREIAISKQNMVSLNIDQLRTGIYILNIKSDNLRFGVKKFIKRE